MVGSEHTAESCGSARYERRTVRIGLRGWVFLSLGLYDPSQIISAGWGDPEHGIEYVRMGTSPFGVWAELSITYEGDGEYNDLLRFWKEIPEAPVFDNETSPRVETRVGEKVASMMSDWYEN